MLKEIFEKDKLEYEFLPPALEIEETPPSPIGRMLIWIIFLLAISVFTWSYFGQVDQVAVARGKVIPDGRVKVIQPKEEGVIRAIHVEEGQRVKTGQILIELDSTIKQAEVASKLKLLAIYKSDKERLAAELKGEDFRAGLQTSPLTDTQDKNISPDIQEIQKKLKEAKESEYQAKEESLKLVIAQKESQLREAEAALAKLQQIVPIIRAEEKAFRQLYANGGLVKLELLNKQKELYSAERELEAQSMVVNQTKDGLAGAKKNLDALREERKKQTLNELMEREKYIAGIEGEVTKAQKRYEFEKISSPVDGYVHQLASSTVGGVVTPAQPVITIVPDGTPLIIEAKALNIDIGFLKAGQSAEVKFDTFPFQKYGTIKGKVVSISPDTIEDEKLGSVYKMKVELERSSLNIDGRDIKISPGMNVSVEVKTGKRRIIEFFLSPIIKYAKESFTLR